MQLEDKMCILKKIKEQYSEKFVDEKDIFSKIQPGHKIFISTACGEPQYLVNAMVRFVQAYPKAFFDTEVFHVWSLGITPYTQQKLKRNFRQNSFFIGDNSRQTINQGLADYTPIFLSEIPGLFYNELVPIDIALIQVSMPTCQGFCSLGVSVDITKAAVEKASLVIAQINAHMPYVHGNSFVHIKDIDYLIHYDEPLLEYESSVCNQISQKIGLHVASIIEDGDTMQVGYGSIPNAILANLKNKKHLGVHTELIGDGIIDLLKSGVIDNSKKNIDRGLTIATFCMGKKDTYEYINDNPSIKFRPVEYTNSPLIIAQHNNMTAINSALEIDLSGQASAESIGSFFYSGIGGHADFMRGTMLSPRGKTILTIQSTAENDTVSRIVPSISSGAGVTLNRGDIHYVVTEYGIAYLHGKNIRERAMDLIAIAHPKFRPWLINEAKKLGIIYKDQAFIPGKKGEYPENLETVKITSKGLKIKMRPVKISDESLLKNFFYSLSDESTYKRFISTRKDMPHERLQEFSVINYCKEIVILCTVGKKNKEIIVGVGQYGIDESNHTAEVALVVRDEYQQKGIGTSLLSYLSFLAKKQGLLGFTAEVLIHNKPMLHLFEKMGFEKRSAEGVFELKLTFRSCNELDKLRHHTSI